ncbi:tafazzin [Plectosphaerella plurivora]|uniref:Tafazzin family protein n=1 Tax=Plectosphaerella plurivora TaxID=936078 RepID=A0A9P8V0U8_9PEZI|nr:tafazzin [Plectosphaerella plurivora]
MSSHRPLVKRGLPWRLSSSLVTGLAGAVSRAFLYGLNKVETTGLDNFLKLLDDRVAGRHKQGLLTVSNHTSVLDDPLVWGALPVRYSLTPASIRWGLGAHDICFRNMLAARFFSLGQILPTHRLLHSKHGGLFQPTMAEAVHALSGHTPSPPSKTQSSLAFTTTAGERYPSPSAYVDKAWVHVFPEACVHQHPELALRYFKWGVSRLVLESNPAPRLVPMFISGFQDIMHENRKKPRWLPRAGANINIVFGDEIDTAELFGCARERWRVLVVKSLNSSPTQVGQSDPYPEVLKWGEEAVQLRIEVAKGIREQVNRLRTTAGYPPDDPCRADAESWKADPSDKHYESPVDGSLVHRE